jgi:hypothetical protein
MNLLESKTDLVSMRGMQDRYDSTMPPKNEYDILYPSYPVLSQLTIDRNMMNTTIDYYNY